MDIIFKEVKWKNLLSYGDDFNVYTFKNGIDLISETNGVGKSTFADAIFYGLFGKPFRKIKTSNLVNRINKKKMEVQIIFSVNNLDYKIIRGIKPNKFEIYKKNNKEWSLLEQRAKTSDYQQYLENNIIMFNETIFRQLLVLGANLTSSKPFMELSNNEKELLFQTLTDTSIFNNLKMVIKDKIQILKKEISELEYKKDILHKSIESEDIMIKQLEEQNKDLEENHNKNIDMVEHTISTLKERILKLTNGLEKIKELKIIYDDKKTEIDEHKTELDIIYKMQEEEIVKIKDNNTKEYNLLLEKTSLLPDETKRLETIQNNLDNIIDKEKNIGYTINDYQAKIDIITKSEESYIECKNCGNKNYINITEEDIKLKEEYYNNLTKLKEELMDIKSNKTLLEIELEDFNTHTQNRISLVSAKLEENSKILENSIINIKEKYSNTINKQLEAINVLEEESNLIKEKLLNARRIKENLEDDKKSLEYNIHKLNELKTYKKVDINYNNINQKIEDLNIIDTTLKKLLIDKDEYSYIDTIVNENNLKGTVIKQQIPFLNKTINYFLELFSMLEYNFIIDENFKEKLISREEEDSEYGQLSNGQKARISFSIMFAFLKLIEERNGIKTNLLVLDEVLDSSVDASGREELLQILKNEFSDTKNIIIISHNLEIKEKVEVFDRIVNIKKDKFSKLDITSIK